MDPAEPDLGSCSGKAGDLSRALARNITSPLPSGSASVALELGLRRASSQGRNVIPSPTPSTLPGGGVNTLYIPGLLTFIIYN
ncbi:hypothetical protein K456DRAFT_1716275 [Colletotrichum gloeosporioides 23]|nr:hypothetical protein K456DRAFT_1716275 [Colletotrichum gloeosporioides 23]